MKITIDPGHGKNDNRSPNNRNYYEGTQMWKLGEYLKTALLRYGFEVVTTRPKITDDPNTTTRGKLAGSNKSDLFISLHSNSPAANPDGSYSTNPTGSVIYYSMTRKETKTLADALGKKISELMGHHYRGSLTQAYPGKPNTDYYAVIRHAAQSGCKCAMLVEHGFHTNLKDAAFLLVDANLKKLAEAEAQIIADYFGVKVTKPNVQTGGDASYRVKVKVSDLAIHAAPPVGKITDKGIYTIVEEKNGYGKLKSGAGWIDLSNTKKV